MSDDFDHTLRKLARGGLILTFGAFISKAIMYLYRIYVAQELGTESYGMITLGLGVFWIMVSVSSSGVGSGLIRKISDAIGKDEEKRIPAMIQSSLITTVPFSILISAIVFLSADIIATHIFSNSSASSTIRIFALAVPFQVVYNSFSGLVKAFQEMRYHALVDSIIRSIFTLVGTVFVLSLGYNLYGALVIQLGAAVLSSILILYFAEYKVFPTLKRTSGIKQEGKELIQYSYPLFLSGIIGLVMSWTDTILLGVFSTVSAVGVYNAAYPTAQLLKVIPNSLGQMLFPQVSEKYGEGEKEKSKLLASTALKWTFVTSFPAVILMVLFSNQIIGLLFGETFSSGAQAMAILGSAYFIQSMSSHTGSYIKSEDETKISFYNSIGAAILNIILNVYMIPRYGTTGAALATSISMTIMAIVSVIEVKYWYNIQPYRPKDYIPSVTATIISTTITYSTLHYVYDTIPKLAMIPAAAAFGAIYAVTFILLGGLNDKDRMIIDAIEKKTGLKLKQYLDYLEKYSIF